MQFQAEKSSRTKRKATSSPPIAESPDRSSIDEHSSLAPVKVRKAGITDQKQIAKAVVKPKKRLRDSLTADRTEASVSTRSKEAEESSDGSRAQERQPSPDWPTVLPEDDEQEETRDEKSQRYEKDEREPLAPSQPQIQESNSARRAKSITPLQSPPSEPNEAVNEDHARLKGGARPSLPLPENAGVTGESGPSVPHNYENSCSPSLDTRSFADMLAEALAGPTSSAHIDDEEDGEILRMFEGSDRVSGLTDADHEPAPRQDTDYQGTDYAQDEAGETWFQPESVVDGLSGRNDNGFYQAHRYDEPEAGFGSLDVLPQGSDVSYAMLPPEILPLPLLDVEEPDHGDSLAPSSMESAEANAIVEPEAHRDTENQALDIFGTDAERARQLLYGRR